VTVTTSAGTSAPEPASAFTYLVAAAIVPPVSAISASPSISVIGAGFTPDSVVIFTAATGSPGPLTGTNLTFVSSTTLQVHFPGKASGAPFGSTYRVTVRTPYGTSAPCPTLFTFAGTSHS
jgi:hypothetical protein